MAVLSRWPSPTTQFFQVYVVRGGCGRPRPGGASLLGRGRGRTGARAGGRVSRRGRRARVRRARARRCARRRGSARAEGGSDRGRAWERGGVRGGRGVLVLGVRLRVELRAATCELARAGFRQPLVIVALEDELAFSAMPVAG